MMDGGAPVDVRNGEPVSISRIPRLTIEKFRKTVIREVQEGARLSALFARPEGDGKVCVYAVLASDSSGTLGLVSAPAGESYPALTPECLPAHLFEREMAEQWGVRPEGHPWLKPVRFHPPYRSVSGGRASGGAIEPGVADFFEMTGEEVHEVAVGPVHAGIIEPGHFRFQCHGEKVYHLEISLGYQHRGVERALAGGPDKKSLHYMETLAGDTTAGHAAAYCHAVEALAGCEAPARAQALRAVALELERLANHTGDLGALAGDIGYLPTASYCGRIRGDFLNMTALVCGNRFGRGWICPGGVYFDTEPTRVSELLKRLEASLRDVSSAANLLWENASVLSRFEDTGKITPEMCDALGLVGPAARSCGVSRDVRFDFPSGLYRFAQIPVSTWTNGDVFSRAYVRWLEIQRSAEYIREQLETLPQGPVHEDLRKLSQDTAVVSLVEGWRGEICHVAMTDAAGKFAHYKIVDPSFHNWMGLAMAVRNGAISDFPLCNKSFNLSYCGHDL